MNTEPGSEQGSEIERTLQHVEQARQAGSAAVYFKQLDSAETSEISTEHAPSAFLDALREHIALNTTAKRGSGGREFSNSPVRSKLLHIHNAIALHQETSVVTDGEVKRLARNIVFFHEDTQGLTFAFLEELYRTFLEDATTFKARGLHSPGTLAIYHSPRILDEIDQKYLPHPLVDRAAILTAFQQSRHNPQAALDEFISQMQEFKEITEPRLRKEYGFEGDWGQWFVRELIQTKEGEKTAREIFSLIAQMHERYPTAPLDQLEALAMRAINYRGERGKRAKASVNELLADVPRFSYDESRLISAREQLEQLRLAQHSRPGQAIRGGRSSGQEGLRLASIAKTNWHPAFDSIDVEKSAHYFWHVLRIYNQRIANKKTYPAIDLDHQNICHMLVIFAQDTAALQKQGIIEPARIARFHGPDAFDHFREKYNVPANTLRRIFAQSACSENGIENTLKRLAALEEMYGDSIPATMLCEWACRPDALTTIQRVSRTIEEAATLYPWATKTDILQACRRTDFADCLPAWDIKIKAIARLYPDHKDLPPYRQKMLAKLDGEVTTIIADYFARLDEIMLTYSDSKFVTRFYALKWAESKDTYLQLATAHSTRVEKFDELLRNEDILHVDPEILGHLAFYNADPEKGVGKFLANRKMLDEYRYDSSLREHIEQWMVDRIATKNTSAKYLRIQLRHLAHLKKVGAFNTYTTPWGESIHERLANPHSDTDDTREQLESVFSRLALLDRKAVMTVFGFAQDISKSELEEELDVPDLDKYVLEEVIPHLARQKEDL